MTAASAPASALGSATCVYLSPIGKCYFDHEKPRCLPAIEFVAWSECLLESCGGKASSAKQHLEEASASISNNIAEGNGRENTGSYIQFLRVSQGSLKELETHVLLAQAVELMNEADAEQILKMSERVGKLLRSLIRSPQDKAAE